MSAATVPIADLIAYLFDGGQAGLAAEVRQRVTASRRFRAFAEAYRDKIRKKARGSRDDEAQRDLAFELAVAALILDDGRFALEYEPYGVGQRAPDFRLTFRGGARCNIEARRLRSVRAKSDAPLRAALTRSICDKLGQLPPGMMNVVALGIVDPSTAAPMLVAIMRELEVGAVAKDDARFRERGFSGARDFLRYYRRLSGVLWISEGAPPQADLWRSPLARHPLAADIGRALARLTYPAAEARPG